MRPLQWLKKGKGFIRPSPGQGPRAVAGFNVLTLGVGGVGGSNEDVPAFSPDQNSFVLTETNLLLLQGRHRALDANLGG